MRIELTVREGPLEGQKFSLDLGHALVGRSPGAGGVVLPGDMLVALKHGELYEQGGKVVYRNLSPAGTLVDGKKVEGEQAVKSGAKLAFGNHHLLEIVFQSVAAGRRGHRPGASGQPTESAEGGGLLGKPLVRVLLVVYGVGILALVVFFSSRGSGDLTADFAEVREEYSMNYSQEGTAEDEIQARLGRADALILQLEIVQRKKDWQQARKICRQLMALDSDPKSPVYQFAARQLGDLAGRR